MEICEVLWYSIYKNEIVSQLYLISKEHCLMYDENSERR